MLASLELKNFRGFSGHRLTFRELTVIVGRNNAGKSTIVEALRLVSIITHRFGALNFHAMPDWLEGPRIYRGVRPDLRGMEFDFATVFHRYEPPPAEIVARFTNAVVVRIFVGGEDELHCVVFGPDGKPIPDKGRARAIELPLVSILPQIGPLNPTEEKLNDDYVRSAQDSRLASLHFRNQLHLDPNGYKAFRRIVEDTWPGVRIRELSSSETRQRGGLTSTELSLLVQNDDFVAEASRMGHGLQMWLQTMWFLARTAAEATVILDEPDVYMHPDLQRRLVRLVSTRYRQAIVATHSTEIIADVDPSNILVVDRKHSESRFATSSPEVQEVIDALGGVHNLHLARLWSTHRFLVLEGDDIDLLGPLHAALFPHSSLALQSLPRGEVGGWSGWERLVGATDAMRRAFGERIKVYALFDSDYHTASAIADRYERAGKKHIFAHIWGRKEIENYLLVPAAIARVIHKRSSTSHSPSAEDVGDQIERVVQTMRADTVSAMVDNLHAVDKRAGAGAAYKLAENWCEQAWQKPAARWAIVSGKKVMSRLSAWARVTCGVPFGAAAVAREMKIADIPEEIARVLGAIEREERIETKWREQPAKRPG
jgi:energy-coupling factor transporter ATP-binding protein EcfA2